MACHYFGAVKYDDPDFVNITNAWSQSCVADGKHPRGRTSGNMLVLYCCDRATDTPSIIVPTTAVARLAPTLGVGLMLLGAATLIAGLALSCCAEASEGQVGEQR